MIKPVYFGNSKEDKFLLGYVNKMDNFSDWVKRKLCEEFDVRIVGTDFGINKPKKTEEVKIDREIKIDEEEIEIKLDQWSL